MKKGTRRIPLTQGKYATVDACDYDFLSQYKWTATKRLRTYGYVWYAFRSYPRGTALYMHQVISKRAGLLASRQYDHADRNGLNNTRHNLRPCSNSQNQANGRKRAGKSSKYKGVCWDRSRNRWKAVIQVNGIPILLGYFKKEIHAARAYAVASLKYYGQFSYAPYIN